VVDAEVMEKLDFILRDANISNLHAL
jgi:hypothetical protein